jgi:hypothetical protein
MAKNKTRNSTRKKLTPQLERFCLAYLKIGEGKAAAIATGYSPKYADRTASRILTYPATIASTSPDTSAIRSADNMGINWHEVMIDLVFCLPCCACFCTFVDVMRERRRKAKAESKEPTNKWNEFVKSWKQR